MDKIGRSDLTGPGYEINSDRVRNQRVIEDAITAWTSKHDADELLKALGSFLISLQRTWA